MIRLCACTKGSASFPESPKQREISKTCKNCGGKLPVDGRSAQPGRMLSSVGLELSSVIDPHLNWKTASNGRRRAVRRARTSFTGGNIKKSTSKSSKDSDDLTDKDSRAGDMPVSESEKLGVSILGRRFSDTLESVPIKKRRFLLVRSPSPPHHSSSHSDGSDHILESQPASYWRTALNAKQHLHDMVCDAKTDLEVVTGRSCDTADFSGISILAAAACDSNIGGGSMNAEGSVSKGHSSEEGFFGKNAKSRFMSEEKEVLPPDTYEDMDGKVYLPGKELNEIKPDRPCNLDQSMNSMQNFPNKTITESSRDDRLHWDLNTVMDVWETHCNEDLNSEPLAANIVSEDGLHDEKIGNVEPCQGQVVFGDNKNASEVVDNRVHLGGAGEDIVSLEEIKMQEKSDAFMGKHYFSLPCGDAPVEEERQFEDVAVADVSEEIKPLHNQEKSCFITEDVSSPVGVSLVPVRDSSLATASVMDEEKAEPHCISFLTEVETKTSYSHLVSCESVCVGHTAHAYEPHQGMDQRIMEAVNEENSNAASLAETNNRSADCCMTVDEMGQVTHLRSCQAESIDSGTGKTDQHLSVNHIAEKVSDVLVDVETAGVISGETASIGTPNETDCTNADKSKEGDLTPCPINSLSSQGLCNNDELPSGTACVGEYETTASETKVTDNKCCVLTDERLNDAKTDPPSHVGSEASLCNSTGMTPGVADAPLPDGALSSQVASKSHPDGYASSPGRVALQDHLDCDYDSDASQNDTDLAIGMEKVEFLGDDDDQYEDGEFRESFVSSWGDDGAEEGETEQVDYGSDREADIFEAASDLPASVNLHVDNIEYKNGEREVQDDASLPSLKYPLVTDVSVAGYGKRIVRSVTEKVFREQLKIKEGSKQLLRDAKDASESGAGNDKVIGDSGFLNAGDGAMESSHSASFRMKLSGWDRLPEGCRSSGDGVRDSRFNSVNKNHNGATLDPSGAGEYVSRVGSSLRRDLSSRIERAKSSDMSQRKDNSYVRESRSNDYNDFSSKVDRDSDASRSIGRNGPSLHLQCRVRGAHWANSPNHHGSSHHDSSGYHAPASFTHTGSRNAAAAAVAKVESNGFVVAPDGTIVKAGGVGPASWLAQRSAKVSSQSTHCSLLGSRSPIARDGAFGRPLGLGHPRQMSPNRHMSIGQGRAGRYGPGMVSIGHREKYRGLMPDDIRDSSSAIYHSVSSREKSFSPPHRRPLHLSRSHTRSPSRSRTRSPHRWASPRGRSDNGMNGGPGLQRRSRYPPNFKSEARMERTRHDFVEHMVTYAPSSTNHTSPPHASRRIDGRKDLSDHFREREYKQCSGRSPSVRVFSRGNRFHLVDSPGRLKPDDCYGPMHSERFPEFIGFGRGSRHDGSGDDRRGHGDRYKMIHSLRQYDIDGNMKRFRYDGEDGFRVHNYRPNYFQRRESPLAFDRGIERQLRDSPRREREEKGHFKHGREGKPSANASFKSFGVRDCDDDLDAQRRRPS